MTRRALQEPLRLPAPRPTLPCICGELAWWRPQDHLDVWACAACHRGCPICAAPSPQLGLPLGAG